MGGVGRPQHDRILLEGRSFLIFEFFNSSGVWPEFPSGWFFWESTAVNQHRVKLMFVLLLLSLGAYHTQQVLFLPLVKNIPRRQWVLAPACPPQHTMFSSFEGLSSFLLPAVLVLNMMLWARHNEAGGWPPSFWTGCCWATELRHSRGALMCGKVKEWTSGGMFTLVTNIILACI